MHKQTWAKVNAPVDEGAKELIEALSSFPKLQTIESCQGNKRGAWVCFWYGDYWENPWQELAEFVLGFLAPYLTSEIGDAISLVISVNEGGVPQGEIAVRYGAIREAVDALRKAHQLHLT